MSTTAVEQSTELAVGEKTKLKKVFRRLDMVLFTICAMVGLDLIGSLANNGIQAVTWLIILAVVFLFPYGLIMSELGTSFPEEGGPYEWVKLAFGRLQAGVFAVFYWITNPFWVGGALAFTCVSAIDAYWFNVTDGSILDYAIKILFVWFSIIVAIASLDAGKWIPNAGAMARVIIVVLFIVTSGIYALKNGVHGLSFGDMSPTMAGFLSIVPLALFGFVGFELQTNAAEEMVDPQKDVPVAISRAGVMTTAAYILPTLGVLFVLPAEEVEDLSGFISAAGTAYQDVWGFAAPYLLNLTVALLILALATSGASWMMGSDRTLAVGAMDGTFFPYFGVLSKTLGTPVRVNLLSGVVGTAFTVAATLIYTKAGSSAVAMFDVVLTIAITTTLLSYLWVFPAAWVLRKKYPTVPRVFAVPGGDTGLALAVGLTTFFVALGSFEAVFPGVIWGLLGEDYGPFTNAWGVSREVFQTLTLGTLAIIVVLALVGYAAGRGVRARSVEVPLD